MLGVLASYELGKGWELGGRFRYTTGFPRTPVVGSFYDGRDDLYQPVFGAQSSTRIPAFYQLDARVEKAFTLRRYRFNAFIDVQNSGTLVRPTNTKPAARRRATIPLSSGAT